jgi:hypothetical protein
MRRLFFLILCLLMPLQGFTAMQVTSAPCPMQGMMSMADAGDDESVDMAETMEDCCNDMATFERTGQSCKSAQSCVVTALGTPSFTALSAPTQVTQDPQGPDSRSLPQGASTGSVALPVDERV